MSAIPPTHHLSQGVMSESQIFTLPGQNQVHAFSMDLYPKIQSPVFTPGSHMMPPTRPQSYNPLSFMQATNAQAYIPTTPVMQTMDRNLFDQRMLYDHQRQQFLRDQRMIAQHQFKQQAEIQRQIEQRKKDQLEVAAVASKLDGQVAAPENLPFKILAHDQKPHLYGVIRLSNLPYSVTRHEIHQLLGRHACVLSAELGGGVHIIMERSTAKTMDAFVEFETQKDAEDAVRRLSFTESGRYARLGTRHVDISLSSQDELLRDIFPRAKCIEWRDGVPILLENTDPYSAGFQGFLTKEEVRGLITHAENPSRSPFTERCRQRTYESLISTLWKYPWFATTMYTVEDRDDLYQATVRQMLELCDKAKQRRFIGLNEALLRDLLRAGLGCPAFNERQKFCLLAASELAPFQPITHWKQLESWPFDCLAKQPKTTEYEVMYYSQLVCKGLGVHGMKDLVVPNNYFNRYHSSDESPWGCLWVEWHFHNKTMMFEAAAQLEMQAVQDILRHALENDHAAQRQSLPSMHHTSPKKSLPEPQVFPSHTMSKQPSLDRNWSLPTSWAEETAKRTAIYPVTPSRHPRSSSVSTVSDDGSLGNSIIGVLRSNSNSTALSGAVSLSGSTNSSFITTDENKKSESQSTQPRAQVDQLSSNVRASNLPRGTAIPRRQHSLSMSSIAASAILSNDTESTSDSSGRSRRGESISIPTCVKDCNGDSSLGRSSWLAAFSASGLPSPSGVASSPNDDADPVTTPGESVNITTLMERHNIWSGTPTKLAVKTSPCPAGTFSRSRYGSRHNSASSLGSQHRRLASVSEDEEDAFKKRTLSTK